VSNGVIMRYEDALKVWGAGKLSCYQCRKKFIGVAPSTVSVSMKFDEGHSCYGHCCSMGEPPSADVIILGTCRACGRECRSHISMWEFDFFTILGEIVVAGGGSVTS
jgi:hypothetical protein